jgi:hypothetical protein
MKLIELIVLSEEMLQIHRQVKRGINLLTSEDHAKLLLLWKEVEKEYQKLRILDSRESSNLRKKIGEDAWGFGHPPKKYHQTEVTAKITFKIENFSKIIEFWETHKQKQEPILFHNGRGIPKIQSA